MKWFFITFHKTLYDEFSAQRFIEKFSEIHKNFKEAEGLCLYDLVFDEEDKKSFYISCPDKYAEHLVLPLAMLRVKPVSRPNKNLIRRLIGNPENSGD